MKKLFFLPAGAVMAIIVIGLPRTGGSNEDSPSYNAGTSLSTCDTAIPVKVELEKTNFSNMNVLFVRDTAATTEEIKNVLSKGYGELMQYVQVNKLRPLRFLAWYYSMQPPWSIDVGVETDKVPDQPTGRIRSRIQPGGEVIIAHMWGPYDQVGKAYVQIENWLKQNKKSAKGRPFEIYLNDPSLVKSPAEIRTDVYQPIE